MKNNNIIQICERCVMDTTASDIIFDDNGICNYCTGFLNRSTEVLFMDSDKRNLELNGLVRNIKKVQKNKPYDCVVGVSGGVDSSWSLVKASKLGLRILAVHMDNGWNSELAQNNIENLVQELGIDLYTHVIDWEEYRTMMQAFFNSHVIDIELLYDNAAIGTCFNMASKYNIKYILAGTNMSSEGMIIPKGWNWPLKVDKKNIMNICKMFSKVKHNTFPFISYYRHKYLRYINGIKWISFLDYFDYNKDKVINILEKEFSYKPYPYKHYESIFTRFYQGYVLLEKHNVDKRKMHFSTLICSKQMSRNEALEQLSNAPYLTEGDFIQDKEYFCKKMGWTEDDLKKYLKTPSIPHENYGSEIKISRLISSIKLFFVK